MDFYLASIAVFIIAIAVLVYYDRKRMEREFILLLRRTSFGKGFITRLGTRFPRFWKAVGVVSVIVCFVVSAWFFWQILVLTADNLTREAAPGVGVILPSPYPTASVGPGYFAIPFWYWVIIIGLLALVHEGFHGIMAAMEKIRIKSLGAGLLLIIPFAFVEPDERQLSRKGPWPQLRVFSAGSFANFLLAGLSIVLLLSFTSAMFMQAGVAFQTYPAARISANDITGIGNASVASLAELEATLEGLEGTVRIATPEGVFYSSAAGLREQLNGSGELAVFEDYGAVRANLTGTIVMVGGKAVTNHTDLEEALEEAGPGKEVPVVAFDGEANRTFMVGTAPEPEPGFSPDFGSYAIAGIEQAIPGTVEFSRAASDYVSALFGNPVRVDWKVIQERKAFWEWAGQSYPSLSQRAGERIASLDAQARDYPRAGFIGIAAVSTKLSLRAGLEPYEMPIDFIEGLLFWMFLINFGVGAFNLLPIGPLDGGKMWSILARRLARKRHRQIMSAVSAITVMLILVNFLVAFRAFF